MHKAKIVRARVHIDANTERFNGQHHFVTKIFVLEFDLLITPNGEESDASTGVCIDGGNFEVLADTEVADHVVRKALVFAKAKTDFFASMLDVDSVDDQT